MWAAFASVVVGLLLLLSELIFPVRGMMMWQSFSNFTSWMTLGAWGAFLAIVVFGVSALAGIPRIAKRFGAKSKSYSKVRRILAAVGIVLGLFVAFYTGMLLSTAPGVPLWDTPLLPCLFLVSGLDTGVALVEIISLALAAAKKEEAQPEAARLLARGVVVLVLLEVLVLAVMLGIMAAGGDATSVAAAASQSVQMLVSGGLAPVFWGMVVVCGLAVPLIAALISLRAKGHSAVITLVGAIGALVGGCELRFLILAAGVHGDIVVGALEALVG